MICGSAKIISKRKVRCGAEQKNSGDFGKIVGAVYGNLPRIRRPVAASELSGVYRDKIIVYGSSVNSPSWSSVIEPGDSGPSAAVLGPTVIMKVGKTAISAEFVIVKP